MATKRPNWTKTNVSWETKEVIWVRWTLGDNIKATLNYLQLNADKYKDAPVDRSTIKKVRDELYRLPADQLRLLLQQSPETESLIFEVRPDIHAQMMSEITPATQKEWLKDHFHIKAIEEHHSEIVSLLKEWLEELRTYYEGECGPASYCIFQIEHDHRLGYVLQHCLSLVKSFQHLKHKRQEYLESMSRLINKISKEIPPESNNSFVEVAAHYAGLSAGFDSPNVSYSRKPSKDPEDPDELLRGFRDNGVEIVIAKGNRAFLEKCESFNEQLAKQYMYSDEAENTAECGIANNKAEDELDKALVLCLFKKEYMLNYCDICRPET